MRCRSHVTRLLALSWSPMSRAAPHTAAGEIPGTHARTLSVFAAGPWRRGKAWGQRHTEPAVHVSRASSGCRRVTSSYGRHVVVVEDEGGGEDDVDRDERQPLQPRRAAVGEDEACARAQTGVEEWGGAHGELQEARGRAGCGRGRGGGGACADDGEGEDGGLERQQVERQRLVDRPRVCGGPRGERGTFSQAQEAGRRWHS